MRQPRRPSKTEMYTVEIERDIETGIVVREEWKLPGGPKHRDREPAYIRRDAITGIVTVEWWLKNGRHHRLDGPAAILRNGLTGHVYSTEWFRDGEKIPAPKRPRSSPKGRSQSTPENSKA